MTTIRQIRPIPAPADVSQASRLRVTGPSRPVFLAFALFALFAVKFSALSQQVQILLAQGNTFPAANRNLTITALALTPQGYIPTYDKIFTNTDVNGSVWLSLFPGYWQCDVKPVWGAVGVTTFYFDVGTNAVQSAFSNLLTTVDNTFPGPNYAYPAAVSDARYVMVPIQSNQVASISGSAIVGPVASAANSATLSNLGTNSFVVDGRYNAPGGWQFNDANQNFFAAGAGSATAPGAYTQNLGIGQDALAGAIGNDDNLALGANALEGLTAGGFNTAIGGDDVLYQLNSGQYNIALGFSGNGTFNASGDNYTGNESYNIDIGNEGIRGESQNIHIGTPGVQTNTTIAGVINGNGAGVTNLQGANVTGSLTNNTTGNAATATSAGSATTATKATSATFAGTATNAFAVGGVPASFRNSPGQTSWMTNINWTEWWSADYSGGTNNQIVTSVPGRNGNILLGNSVYQSQYANGRPAWTFDNSGNMVLTNGMLGVNYTNTGTMFIVWTFPQSSFDGSYHIALTTTLAANVTDWIFYALDGGAANSGYAIQWHYPGTGSPKNTESTAWGTHVGLLTWTPTNSMWFIDGKAMETFPNGNAQAQGGGTPWSYGFAGMLTLGYDAGFGPLNGGVSEIGISSNTLIVVSSGITPTAPAADQINNYLMAKYGLLYHDTYGFLGDSIVQGAYANWNGSPEYLMASNFPGEQVMNWGSGGSTAGENLTNAQVMFTTSTFGGRSFVFIQNSAANDSSLGLAVITNQTIALAKMARSNNITPILVIPPSSQPADQTLYNGISLSAGLRNVWSNSWPTYFAAVVPLNEEIQTGPTNSWSTNPAYYANNTHPNTLGYAAEYPYYQAALNYALNPHSEIVFTGPTNEPPPWQGVDFICFEGGHRWHSGGGNSWALDW